MSYLYVRVGPFQQCFLCSSASHVCYEGAGEMKQSLEQYNEQFS